MDTERSKKVGNNLSLKGTNEKITTARSVFFRHPGLELSSGPGCLKNEPLMFTSLLYLVSHIFHADKG